MTKLAAKESHSKKAPSKREEPPPKKEHKSPKTAPPAGSSSGLKGSMPRTGQSSSSKKTATKDAATRKKDSDLKSMFRLAILLYLLYLAVPTVPGFTFNFQNLNIFLNYIFLQQKVTDCRFGTGTIHM